VHRTPDTRHLTSDTAFTGSALNECVVTAGAPFRMITLSLRIDGHEGPTVSGDGIIVSTRRVYGVQRGRGWADRGPSAGAIAITRSPPTRSLSVRSWFRQFDGRAHRAPGECHG